MRPMKTAKTFDGFYEAGCAVIDTGVPGPSVVLMAGVHGDEPCGLDAFRELIPDVDIEKGKLTFLLGNRKAIEAGTREYQENLNRIFQPDKNLTDAQKQTYEYKRSREMMPVLAEADISLDLHSSSTSETEPFVICEPHSNDIATYLPANIVVSGFDELHPTGTDAYVNQQGGKGICLECGNHTDASAKKVAIEAVKNLLHMLGMQKRESVSQSRTQKILHAIQAYKTKEEFKQARPFADFEDVSSDTLIGYDGDTPLCANTDGVAIFVKEIQTPGKQAFMIAEYAK